MTINTVANRAGWSKSPIGLRFHGAYGKVAVYKERDGSWKISDLYDSDKFFLNLAQAVSYVEDTMGKPKT